MWRGRVGRLINNPEGSIAVICAVAMVSLMAVASIAIDLGHLYSVRNEMQNTVDAAAMTAARSLLVPDPNDNHAVYRDSDAATTAAMNIIQQESQLQGLPAVAADSRNDVTIKFASWDDKSSTWTDLGASVPTTSPANAVEITLKRSTGTIYGPVTNFFAGAFGVGVSTVTVASRAYMGYTYSVYEATVPIPLALPVGVLQVACKSSHPGWFARTFGPREAVAAASTETYTFTDNGGNLVNSTISNNPTVDPNQTNQAYWFVVGSKDSVPDTIVNILKEAALTNHTHSNTGAPGSNRTVYFVDPLSYGTPLYPKSEFKWSNSYLVDNFKWLKQAYDSKKDANGRWRVTLPVVSTTQYPLGTSRRLDKALRFLARLLSPSEALACYSYPPPLLYVNGFVNADIIAVNYNYNCNTCNYSFPKTISGVKYTTQKNCMAGYSASCWNQNYVKLQNVTDASTIIPNSSANNSVGGEGGGLSNKQINDSAPNGVGAFASIPKLIK